MRVLFLHDAFPAQFGHVALEMTRRHGWECHFLVEAVSNCPTPSQEMIDRLDVRKYPLSEEYRKRAPTPWPQIYGKFLELCEAVYESIRKRPELKPDLIVGHGGRGRRRRSSATWSTARSSIIANITSASATETSRTGSTCRPPSRRPTSPGASMPRCWSA